MHRRISLSAYFVVIIPILFSPECVAGLPHFEVPKFMRVTLVADAMKINGLNTRVYQFRSEKNAVAIEQFYQQLWRGALKQSKTMDMNILSYVKRRRYLFVVQIEANESVREANGLLSVCDLDSIKHASDTGFPMLSSSQLINDVEASDLGKHSRTLLIQNQSSVRANRNFYRHHFSAKGWIEQGVSSVHGRLNESVLLMQKGGDELNMTIQAVQGNTYVVLVLVEK